MDDKAAAPNSLRANGCTKASLTVSTEHLVEGFRAKDGSDAASGDVITFRDGKKLFIGLMHPARASFYYGAPG